MSWKRGLFSCFRFWARHLSGLMRTNRDTTCRRHQSFKKDLISIRSMENSNFVLCLFYVVFHGEISHATWLVGGPLTTHPQALFTITTQNLPHWKQELPLLLITQTRHWPSFNYLWATSKRLEIIDPKKRARNFNLSRKSKILIVRFQNNSSLDSENIQYIAKTLLN